MQETEIKIIDLGEATALLTLGFTLMRLESSNTGKHKVFVFELMHPNSSTIFIPETIDNYNRRKLQVDAYSFYRSGKDLKNKIHEHNELTQSPG